MRICKYCKKPISDDDIWNPDSEGNGYHHACLCEMEFKSRDRQIYNKGRADVLEKIRTEITEKENKLGFDCVSDVALKTAYIEVLKIIDKYRQEG